jgi:outer membrane protein TolC/ABC-type uncharacterized transport system substrate-binding protein
MMSQKRFAICLFLLAFVTIQPADARAQSGTQSTIRIGTVVDGPWVRNDEVLTAFRQEILALTEREFDVQFPDSKHLIADFTTDGVTAAVDQLLADREVDLVVALGPLSSHVASSRGALSKPLIAPFVLEPEVQGLPMRNGTSGVENLSYLTIPATVERDVDMFQEIAPFTRLTVMANRYLIEAIPRLHERVKAKIGDANLTVEFVRVGDSVEEALAAVPADAQAIYIFPLLQLSEEEFRALVDGLNERKLPTFSYLGEKDVERGVLAGLNPDIFPRLTRRVALNVQRILLGEDPGSIPTAFSAGEHLFINLQTASVIQRYPSWAILTEAELIGEDAKDAGRFLTLDVVMQEAITANLDLAAAERFVASGAEEVKGARSIFFPQIDIAASASAIDEDRAALGFPQPQRALVGSATLTQIILNDPAFANYSIQKHIQNSRVEGLNEVRLDIAQQGADAYLNVLRAVTLERILREDLQLSRTNLELARVREAIGQSGPSDVYRWESSIATNRKEAIEANALRNVAEMELNRVLHQPLEAPFQLEETLVQDPQLFLNDYPYLAYFNDKVSFRAFRTFLVQEGIASSPEIKQLDAVIGAADRTLSAAGREFWLPKIGIFGSVSYLFDSGGAGSDPIPGLEVDDTQWEVGAQLSYPIFNGLGRIAEKSRAREELRQIETERLAVVERIEQRIRSALHLAGSSFAGIQQAINASVAARNNLDLVTDSYSRGTMSIIELLDAQNAYIVADEGAANSVYDFLLDLMEVQRAVGRFDVLMTPEELSAFDDRLKQYMDERDVQPAGAR